MRGAWHGCTTGHAMQGHGTRQHALPTERATDSAAVAPVVLVTEEARGATGQALSTQQVGGGQPARGGSGWDRGSGRQRAAVQAQVSTASHQHPAGSRETERMQADRAASRISKGGRICRHTWRPANRRSGAHKPRGLAAKRERSPAQPQVRRRKGRRGCGPERPRCRLRRHEPPAAVQRAPPASVLPALAPPPRALARRVSTACDSGQQVQAVARLPPQSRGLFGTCRTATSAHLGRFNACLSTCTSAMDMQTERQGPAGHSSGAHGVGEREQLPGEGPPLRQAHTTSCRRARPRKAPRAPCAQQALQGCAARACSHCQAPCSDPRSFKLLLEQALDAHSLEQPPGAGPSVSAAGEPLAAW